MDCRLLYLTNCKKPQILGIPPNARYGHSAILAGSRVIIFGGKGEKNLVLMDIHAFDPMTMTWFQGPEGSGSPCARFGHTGSIINNNQMLVFGGWNMDSFFNDVYLLNLQTMCWYKPETKGILVNSRSSP